MIYDSQSPYRHPLTVDVSQTKSRLARKFKKTVDLLPLRLPIPIEIVLTDRTSLSDPDADRSWNEQSWIDPLTNRAESNRSWVIRVNLDKSASVKDLIGQSDPLQPLTALQGLAAILAGAIGAGRGSIRRKGNRHSYGILRYYQDPQASNPWYRSIWDILPLTKRQEQFLSTDSGEPGFFSPGISELPLKIVTTHDEPYIVGLLEGWLSDPTFEFGHKNSVRFEEFEWNKRLYRRLARRGMERRMDYDLRKAEFISWLTQPGFWALSVD